MVITIWNAPHWGGRPLVPSRRGQEEMDKEGLDLQGVARLLEEARPSGRRRKPGIREMVVARGERSYEIVVAESLQHSSQELVHLLIHIKSVRRP